MDVVCSVVFGVVRMQMLVCVCGAAPVEQGEGGDGYMEMP